MTVRQKCIKCKTQYDGNGPGSLADALCPDCNKRMYEPLPLACNVCGEPHNYATHVRLEQEAKQD